MFSPNLYVSCIVLADGSSLIPALLQGFFRMMHHQERPENQPVPGSQLPLSASLDFASPRVGSADSPFPGRGSGEGAQTPGWVPCVVVHERCASCSCYSSRSWSRKKNNYSFAMKSTSEQGNSIKHWPKPTFLKIIKPWQRHS